MFAAAFVATITLANAAPSFREIAPGVEYAESDGFHIVRVDASKANVVAKTAKDDSDGGRNKTAAQWAESAHLSVVMNAGMFLLDDMQTHEGYFRVGEHVHQKRWKSSYQSVLAILGAPTPGVLMQDCDDRGLKECPTAPAAAVVVQNLRIIAAQGGPPMPPPTPHGVWKENDKRWSEAALAVDDKSRLLFIFSREGMSMRTWAERVLKLGIGVTRAMHAEGGPEASLSIRTPTVNVDLSGSYETGFNENDDNKTQWPIPNVIGVVSK